MTKKEIVERNIGITFDFVKHIVDHPEVIDTIVGGAEIDFIDKDMPSKVREPIRRKKVARYRVEHRFEAI